MYKKIKIYTFSTLILTSISTLLYIAAYLFSFDTNIGYLNTNSMLTSLSTAISILTAAWIASFFKTFPKGKLSNDSIAYSRRTRIIAFFVALILVICNTYRFFTSDTNYIPSNITLICILAGIISSLYFFLISFRSTERSLNIKIIFGIFPIVFSTLTITESHLNSFITMNSPIKISLLLAMMSTMLFMLYEIRSLANKHQPRGFIVTSLSAFLLLSIFSVPYIVSYLANNLLRPEKSLLYFSIIAFSSLIYILSRIFDTLKHHQSVDDN